MVAMETFTYARPQTVAMVTNLENTDGLHDDFDACRWVLHRLDDRDVVLFQRVESLDGSVHSWHGFSQLLFTLILGVRIETISSLDRGVHEKYCCSTVVGRML